MNKFFSSKNLLKLDIVEVIPDPIWDEIPVTQIELVMIRTNIFKRLRHIRQMGVAYLKFPGANHTRYEHSLGTLKVATLLYNYLCPNMPAEFMKESILNTIRISALLHDIGHPPYSHVVEETFKKYPELLDILSKAGKNSALLRNIIGEIENYSHELFTKYLIEKDKDIGEILDQASKIDPQFPKSEISI